MRRQMWMPEICVWSRGRIAAHFALVAQVEGRITASQLHDAVTRLCHRHSLLASRVVAEPDYTYWFDDEGAAPIEPHIIPREDENTWLAAAVQTVGPLFDCERGPLARVTLVESPERSEIILAMHHCAGDGLSGAYALHDLLTLLGDPTVDLPPLNVSRCPADLLPRWIRLLAGIVPIGMILPGLRKDGPVPPMSNFSIKHGDFHILAWKLPPDRTQTLVARSRAENVRVHSALSTAFLRAWAEIIGGESHSVSSPVSVRRYFAEPVGMALGTMVWPYVKAGLPNTPEVPFWEQADQFQADLESQISTFRMTFPLAIGHRAVSRYPLERVIAAFDMEEETSDHTLSITNLGRLSLAAEYGSLRLVGFFGPLLDANAKEVVLGAATTNGTLEFTMTFREPVLSPETAVQIRDAALAQLDTALS